MTHFQVPLGFGTHALRRGTAPPHSRRPRRGDPGRPAAAGASDLVQRSFLKRHKPTFL